MRCSSFSSLGPTPLISLRSSAPPRAFPALAVSCRFPRIRAWRARRTRYQPCLRRLGDAQSLGLRILGRLAFGALRQCPVGFAWLAASLGALSAQCGLFLAMSAAHPPCRWLAGLLRPCPPRRQQRHLGAVDPLDRVAQISRKLRAGVILLVAAVDVLEAGQTRSAARRHNARFAAPAPAPCPQPSRR